MLTSLRYEMKFKAWIKAETRLGIRKEYLKIKVEAAFLFDYFIKLGGGGIIINNSYWWYLNLLKAGQIL